MTFSPRPRRYLSHILVILVYSTALAQTAGKPPPDAAADPHPEIIHNAAGTTEIGILASAPYRIDVPANWNHALVVYFHGYAETPYSYHASSPLGGQTQPLFDRGYAVVQSGYSAVGWALAEAYPETEQLRRYFIKHYGEPALGKSAKNMETIVAGGSMGGALVVASLELNPKVYTGGLDLCGSVGPTDLAFQRRFAWRAAFDFYFPGVMPTLVPSPADFHESHALRQRIEDAIKANPVAGLAMRDLIGLHTDGELAGNMVYFTYVIADMQHRSKGNPFDNRNFLYAGTSPSSSASDNALNEGVHRYAAEPGVRDYLLHHYTPTGQLTRPMLALHTTYDPVIPSSSLTVYGEQVAIAGFEQNLVQQFVPHDGHCTFSPEDVGRTFDELVLWMHTGQRPIPGLLPHASPAVSKLLPPVLHALPIPGGLESRRR